MSRGERHTLLHVVKHLAHMRERVVLRVAQHRVVLALCNLAHLVTFFNLGLFRHLIDAFMWFPKRRHA